jgi:Protein tyrosine and serine/threonine kinase
LGRGEFGDVWEMKAIHDEFDCTCTMDVPDVGGVPFEHRPAQIEIIEAISFNKVKEKKEGVSSVSMSTALNNHRRAISAVSFADEVKEAKDELPLQKHDEDQGRQYDGKQNRLSGLERTIDLPATSHSNIPSHEFIDNNDNSTLSTSEEESVTHAMESEGIIDGEVAFLRRFMSTHTTRQGIARYAIKRARHDLTRDAILEAVVDLAVEAKFLATMRHPNIVRMRGTVGTPGSEGFMIVMDRLQMTLREKMVVWNRESKGQSVGLHGKLLGNKSNTAVQREQYADKLLAIYDIARAMRYLHNHM